MLTSLSHKIRLLVDAALGRAGGVAPAAPAIPAVAADGSAAAARPALRLVQAGEAAVADRDIPIRVAAGSSVGASAFVAGAGARIYSLDVFRRARQTSGPGPRSPAAPVSPHAA